MTGYPVDVAALAAELAPLVARELRPPDGLLSPAQVADRLGLSPRTVRDMIADGRIPSFKVEGARKIEPAAVDAYIAACKATAA
jgi:excisionase family DNA binding protein